MTDTQTPTQTDSAPATEKTESKAAAAFTRFKEARAAAATAAEGSMSSSSPGYARAGFLPPTSARPTLAMPPSFSLSQQGWLPQPGMVQPAPLATGSLGDRLGSTLRLGVDVINMALAGSLRLMGGIGYDVHEHGYGGHDGCCHRSGADDSVRHDCGCDFEHDDCCTPGVGNCCD